MIIDLPLGADIAVLDRAARQTGLRLGPIGQVRTVCPRDIGEQVTRIDSVRIQPFDDTYRAYAQGEPNKVDGGYLLGRRKPSVCWHGHREWMRAILREYPAAAIRSHVATYLGSDDFEATHKGTEPVDTRNGMCRCED